MPIKLQLNTDEITIICGALVTLRSMLTNLDPVNCCVVLGKVDVTDLPTDAAVETVRNKVMTSWFQSVKPPSLPAAANH